MTTVQEGRPALLIAGTAASQEVHQVHIFEDEMLVAPLHWAIRRKPFGGTVYMSDMTCARVQKVELVGIARPREVGAPLLSSFYLLLMSIGLFTLSVPVRLKLTLGDIRPVDSSELVRVLTEAVSKNPNYYTRASASDILQGLARAKSFLQMRKAFD